MNYQFARWETAASDIQFLVLEKLFKSDDCTLEFFDGTESPALVIILRDVTEKRGRRFQFLFRSCVSFKLIKEEYYHCFVRKLCENHPGTSAIVENSAWLAEVKAEEPLVNVRYADLQHYLIVTLDYVIEILGIEPLVEELPKESSPQ